MAVARSSIVFYGVHMETKSPTARQVEKAMTKAERTKKWTAEKAGFSVSTMNRKLNGGGDFTVDEVYRIAVALGCHPSELLPEEFAMLAAA